MSPWWLLLLAPSLVHAQEVEEGTVTGIVFSRADGAPLEGVLVEVGGVQTRTDRLGRFVLSLPEGVHPVRVVGPDRVSRPSVDLPVAAGRTSELLLTWAPDLAVLPAQVEAPELAPVASAPQEGVVGSVAGRLTSSEDGAPVVGARIFVRGLAVEAQSDADGRFHLDLPPGSWELSVIASAFASQGVPEVVVAAGQETPIQVQLVPAGVALDDFTVRVPKVTGGTSELLEERKTGSAVADILGAEQMARTGDANAASALRRVTGLTVVGGRFIYVRGLGERYSTTLLNGGQLPSPEPERRVVPLDLFPASILDSVVIQKTFSPDLPAEFGGGTVLLRTKAFPRAPVVQIQVSGTVVGGTSFVDGSTSDGGPTDALGIDGGTRALDPAVVAASAEAPLKERGRFSTQGYTSAELADLGKTFPNVWSPRSQLTPPDWGFNLALGNGFEPGGRPLGVLFALSYADGWQTNRFRNVQYSLAGKDVVSDTDYAFDRTERNVRLSGMLSLGAEPAEGHRIQSTTLVLRNTDDEARTFEGFLPEEAADIRVSRLRWVERMLIVQQLVGSHEIDAGAQRVRLDWRYGFAKAFRNEPDRRETRYDELGDGTGFTLSRRDGDANSRFFSDLQDQTHDAALDLSLPFAMRSGSDAVLKLGGMFLRKDRTVDTRRYTFVNKGFTDEAVLQLAPEAIFTPANIREDAFQVKEVTQTTDNYVAQQTIGAGYAMATVPALRWLEVMAGARVEHGRQEVTTFELFNPDGVPIVSELSNTDVLPAVTAAFAPREDVKVRLGYGRTVSRPEFRELSPAIYQDVIGGRDQFGNPELKRGLIDNVDARVEWFPGRGDVLALSGFFKSFTQPIEQIVIVGADESLTYGNALGANNFGAEVEILKHLEFIDEAVRDVYVSANASLISSRIVIDPEAGGVQTNDERALQGQSPWVVNLQLGYDNPDLGLNAVVLYNVFGPRITQVGSFGLPDTYEMPFHSLDVVVNYKLPKGFDLRFTGRNLADQKNRFELGTGELIEERRDGWRLGLRVGWSL
ncbi:MAG: TonB-dependent receptor [Alphaproteobacteria bacterium]|nr:TonB-dependent receptor [Alphaproteobacteria bacterium]